MPGTISHALSMTTPDDPAYENQPKHWNSSHLATLDLVGSEFVGGFSNANGVSFGLSAGQVTASIAAGGAPGSLSAGTESFALGNATFSNSNGVSFGLNAGVMTASHDGLTNIKVSAGTLSQLRSDITFSNSNGMSFGLNTNGVVTASYTANPFGCSFADSATTGSIVQLLFENSNNVSWTLSRNANLGSIRAIAPIKFSAGTLSGTRTDVTFSNANGVSFGLETNGIITASVGAGGAPGSLSAGTESFALGNATFSNSNGISFGLNAGVMTASHNGLTSQSNQALSGSNGSFAFQTATFGNLNGLSFYTSNGSMVGSYTVPVQSNQNISFFALGNTTQNSSTVLNASQVSFNGLGGMTVGFSNGSIQLSGATGGGGGGGITLSGYNPYRWPILEITSVNFQASLHIMPWRDVPSFQFDNVMVPLSYSNASNSTGSATLSVWLGLYTRNASTLSLAMSSSRSVGITFSGTGGNQSLQAGLRQLPIGWTTTVTASDYWFGFVSRTTTGGANASFNIICNSQVTWADSGHFGVATNATRGALPFGMGWYSATTSGMPGSIAFTQIDQSNSAMRRAPIVHFQSQTF